MRIFKILPYEYLPDTDSRSNNVRSLNDNLYKYKLDISIFAPNLIIINNVIKHRFKNKIFGSLLMNYYILRYHFKLNPDIYEYRPDNFLLIFPLLIKKNKLIFNIHSYLIDEFKESSCINKINILLTSIIRFFIISKKSTFIFNHPKLENFYKKKYSLINTYSIYNGSKKVNYIKKPKTCKKIKCVFIGAISIWRDLNTVYNFISTYNNEFGTEIEFHTFGKSHVNNLNKNIINHGHISFKRLLNEINEYDFAILNVNDYKKSPGSPIKLFDYASFKLPILSIENIEGYSDLIEMYDIGMNINFYDTNLEELNKLNSFILNINSNYYQAKNFNKFIQDHSWEELSKKWKKIYEISFNNYSTLI